MVRELQSEIFLVHQDAHIAKVSVDQYGKGWTVQVVGVQSDTGRFTKVGHAVAVPGSIDDAKQTGVVMARDQIAAALAREANRSGHVLFVACSERAHGGGFDALIEVHTEDGMLHRHVIAPVPDREQARDEAIAFAAQLLRHVTGVRMDGTLIT